MKKLFLIVMILFLQSSKGEYINADVNGSYQIMKKVFPKAFANGIVDAGSHPVVVNIPLQTANVI